VERISCGLIDLTILAFAWREHVKARKLLGLSVSLPGFEPETFHIKNSSVTTQDISLGDDLSLWELRGFNSPTSQFLFMGN
jgi:hypothetical protein